MPSPDELAQLLNETVDIIIIGGGCSRIDGLCQKNLNIKRPSYDNLNRLIAKVI